MPRFISAAVVAAATVGVLLGVPAAASADTGPTVVAPDSSVAAQESAPLVVVGTAGIVWQDVTPETAPVLTSLLQDGWSAGAVTVPTRTSQRCDDTGWLWLSSGRRALTGEPTASRSVSCVQHPVIVDGGSASVDGWASIVERQVGTTYLAHPGLLGTALADAGVCATAVGRGAALALATDDGNVGRYRLLGPALADPTDTFSCPITIVDAGDARLDPDHAAAVRRVDTTIGRILAAVPDGSDVIVVDTANPASVTATLGISLAHGSRWPNGRTLTTASTRWDGVFSLLDVPSTVLATVGIPDPPDFAGSPVVTGATLPDDAATSLAMISDRDHELRSVSVRWASVPPLLALVLALLGLLAPRAPGWRAMPAWGRRTATAVWRGAVLVLAAFPVASFLVTLTRWWLAPSPVTALVALTMAISIVIAGLSSLLRDPVRVAGAIAGVTTLTLTVDGVLGTPLHRGSPFGPAPTLGGRYYGFGNPTFCIYAAAAIVAAAAIAHLLTRRGHQRWGAAAAAAIGTVALAVDVLPAWGADVGGGLVLLPAFAILVAPLAGVRLSLTRMAGIVTAGVVAVVLAAVADWMRPAASRSHLGRFWQSVLDGDAFDLVARKGRFALRTMSAPMSWVSLAVLVAVVAALVVPRLRTRVDAATAGWPALRPAALAIVVTSLAGAALNDYGMRMATATLAAATPLIAWPLSRLTPARPDGDGT